MERGIRALERGDTEEALGEYRKAQALLPEAPIPHLHAGRALESLRRHREALTAYETYLRLKPGARDAALVRAVIERIRQQHLEGVLDVRCTPAGAEVFLDRASEPVGTTPLPSLRVAVGDHEITLRRAAHKEKTLTATITGGATVVLQCELEPDRPVELVPPPAPPPRGAEPLLPAAPPALARDVPDTRWYGRWWVWAGAAVIAAGATTTVLLLTRTSPPDSAGGTHSFPLLTWP